MSSTYIMDADLDTIFKLNGVSTTIDDSVDFSSVSILPAALSWLEPYLYLQESANDVAWQLVGMSTTINDTIDLTGVADNVHDITTDISANLIVSEGSNEHTIKLTGFSTSVTTDLDTSALVTNIAGITIAHGDLIVTDANDDVIYYCDGFSTTDLDSNDYTATTGSPNAISWDGVNLLVGRNWLLERLYQFDGFSTSLLTTTNLGDISIIPYGIESGPAEDRLGIISVSVLDAIDIHDESVFEGEYYMTCSGDANLYRINDYGTLVMEYVDLSSFLLSIFGVTQSYNGDPLISDGETVYELDGFSSTIVDNITLDIAVNDSIGAITTDGMAMIVVTLHMASRYVMLTSMLLDQCAAEGLLYGATYHTGNFIWVSNINDTVYKQNEFTSSILDSVNLQTYTKTYDVSFSENNMYITSQAAVERIYEFNGFSSSVAEYNNSPAAHPQGIEYWLAKARLDLAFHIIDTITFVESASRPLYQVVLDIVSFEEGIGSYGSLGLSVVDSISFVDSARHNIKITAALDAIIFVEGVTHVTPIYITVIDAIDMSDTRTVSQNESYVIDYIEAEDYAVGSGIIGNVRSVIERITFTDSARQSIHIMNITDAITFNDYVAQVDKNEQRGISDQILVSEAVAVQQILYLDLADTVYLNEKAARAHDAEAEDTITFAEVINRNYPATDSIIFTEVVGTSVTTNGAGVDEDITFTETVAYIQVFNRSVSDSVTMVEAALGYVFGTANLDTNYHPVTSPYGIDATPEQEIETATFTISDGEGNDITLPNPEFMNDNVMTIPAANNKTLRGDVKRYRSANKTVIWQLSFIWRARTTTKDTYLSWRELVKGKELTLTDHENRTWVGTIIDPVAQVQEYVGGIWTFGFEFLCIESVTT